MQGSVTLGTHLTPQVFYLKGKDFLGLPSLLQGRWNGDGVE
jgi:hypothetical protein